MKTMKLEASIGDRANTWSFDYTWDCPVPDGLTAMHEGLLQKGFGETLRDASSTLKVKNDKGLSVDPTPEQRNGAVLARLAKIKDGSYVFGGGGTRGPSHSIPVAAWLTYFKSKAWKIKLVDKTGKKLTPTAETLEVFQRQYVREAIWPSVRKVLADMTREQQDAFRKDKLPGIITTNMEKVIAQAEADEQAIKPYIDAETLKRQGGTQKDEGFHVEVEISI